jgi:hypothetical protein
MKGKGEVQPMPRANRGKLNPQGSPDFLDSALQWRRMCAEVAIHFCTVPHRSFPS